MKKVKKKKEKPKEYEPDIEIEDDMFGMGGYGKDKDGYKHIVLDQYRKCCEEGSKEMTSGGVLKRIVDGELVEIMTMDQIEIFSNSVEMLKNLLLPSIKKFKDKFQDRISSAEAKIRLNEMNKKKAYKKLNFWYRQKSSIVNPEGVSEAEMNHKSYVMMNKEIVKIYNKNVLRTHIELLGVLGLLLSHLNYFDEMGGMSF